MFRFLKNHPFEVEAFFESSVVLTFSFHKEQLQKLIPGCLELDTYNDQWAFIAIALVQTRNLRPKGFPPFMGNDFFLAGYRVFVRYTNTAGKNLRGLYILKSETDKRRMQLLGNIFTHYNYSKTDIVIAKTDSTISYSSAKSDLEIEIESSVEPAELPEGSPFQDWKEARRFAGPLPFTFTYDQSRKRVLIIEGVRQNWTPIPVKIKSWRSGFFHSVGLEHPTLANAFIIQNIPYYWKKGKIEQWK